MRTHLEQSLIEDQTTVIMNFEHIIQRYKLSNTPLGLGGCQALGPYSFEACGYDLFVFDDNAENACDTVTVDDDKIIIIRHASLSESNSEKILQYDGLRVIQDATWDLNMLLLRIKEKRDALYNDLAKNALMRALFCCQKVAESTERPDVFASCWQKSASFYLADAICSLNHKRISPSHMFEALHNIPKNPVNEHLATVMETIGIERTSPTLLARMVKSTVGFSDMMNWTDGHSKLIIKKYNFFVDESMLTDCYFYLGYINKENISKKTDTLYHNPELIHVLKVAIDAETDHILLNRHVELIQNSCRELLNHISRSD